MLTSTVYVVCRRSGIVNSSHFHVTSSVHSKQTTDVICNKNNLLTRMLSTAGISSCYVSFMEERWFDSQLGPGFILGYIYISLFLRERIICVQQLKHGSRIEQLSNHPHFLCPLNFRHYRLWLSFEVVRPEFEFTSRGRWDGRCTLVKSHEPFLAKGH